jgi:hypothetical protein
MRGGIANEYRKLNSEDQKTFRLWLWANTVVVSNLTGGIDCTCVEGPRGRIREYCPARHMRTPASHAR